MNNIQLLKRTLEKNKDEYIQFLCNLISIKTENIGHGVLGGFEKFGQEYLKELMLKIGYKVKEEIISEENILFASKNYNEGNPNHNYYERYNLIGEIDDGILGKIFVFNGHIDTMPPGNLDNWKNNPYEAIIKDGKIYGLGAADMKAGLMASILSAKLIKDSNLKIPGKIKILSMIDEEGGGNGTLNACMNGIDGDYCIVAEPCENNIYIAHMGFIIFEINVKGISLHCGRKWEGENAIDKTIKIISALKELENLWLMKYQHSLLPPPTINIGTIAGGNAASTVPNECRTQVCIHFLPQMGFEKTLSDIKKCIYNISQSDEFLKINLPDIRVYQQGNPFELINEENYIKVLKANSDLIFDKTTKILGAAVGNDARLMMNIGKIPTVIMGPGSISQCHSPNEYVEINSYLNHILAYASFILDLN